MQKQTIGFIGGGRVTGIILAAFKNAAVQFDQVHVFDPQETVLEKLKRHHPHIVASSGDKSGAARCDFVFLAVHPPVMAETLAGLSGKARPETIIISLAPKFTIGKMSEALGGFSRIARINPSASSIMGIGINPVSFSGSMTEDEKARVKELMASLGSLPEVAESKIEAYAMISAMGHTYFWPQLEKLRALAIAFGMDNAEAMEVIAQMLNGTSETLFRSGLSYAEVIDLVPVKPLGEAESAILGYYDQYLTSLYQKIRP